MGITPWIIGRGRSGEAIARGLASLAISDPELGLAPVRWVARSPGLTPAILETENPVLFIANPHGLHARTLLEAVRLGIRRIVCEKPAAVSLEEVRALRGVEAEVAVLHVYRAMWGARELKRWINEGKLGQLIAIEGRYWQASAAEAARRGGGPSKSWKNDPSLGSDYDAYLDIATHWVDLACFLTGATRPERVRAWLSHANAEAPHRDTHVQLTLELPGGVRGQGSVSKTVHGATNRLEIHALGTRGTASWCSLQPDEIELGEGLDRRVVTRRAAPPVIGSGHAPFHGLGWLEGHIEIFRSFLSGGRDHPTLGQNLDLLEAMLSAEIEGA